VLLASAATLGVLATLAAWRAATRASGVLTLVLVSFFVAAACEPVVNRLARRGWRRGLAAGMLLGGALVVVVGVLAGVGAGALGELAELRDAAPALAADLESVIGRWTGASVNLDALVRRIQTADVTGAVSGVALQTVKVIGQVLAGLFVSFYLIVDGPRLRKRLCSLLPPRHQGEVLRVWDLAVEKTGGYLGAKVVLALISTLVHWIGFTALGVAYPIPLAIWVGVVSQVVPIVGTVLAIGLPVVLSLAAQEPGVAIAILVFATVFQQVENTLLAPRLTAQAVDVHPAVGFVAVLVAAAAFGPLYTLLIIPVVATVQGFVTAYVRTHELIDDPRLVTGEIPVLDDRDAPAPSGGRRRSPRRR